MNAEEFIAHIAELVRTGGLSQVLRVGEYDNGVVELVVRVSEIETEE